MGRGQDTPTTQSAALRSKPGSGSSRFTANLDGLTDVNGGALSGDYAFQQKIWPAEGGSVRYQFVDADGNVHFVGEQVMRLLATRWAVEFLAMKQVVEDQPTT